MELNNLRTRSGSQHNEDLCLIVVPGMRGWTETIPYSSHQKK